MTSQPNKLIKNMKIGANIKEILIECEGYNVSLINNLTHLLLVVTNQEILQH